MTHPTDALHLVLVPRDPTVRMVEAAFETGHLLARDDAKNIWHSMRAAAPASPLPGGGDEGLIAELKALQAFAADEISWAFCAGFKDAIDREKWDDCYDFAAAKAGDYRNDRIRAFLARNGKATRDDTKAD